MVADRNRHFGGNFSYRISSCLIKSGAFLNHNHTHFLLVDDCTENDYGAITFRSNIEKELAKSKSFADC